MSDDEATVSCPMRRLGASRVPAWTVVEFAGAEACAALCLASREWDAAVASSPLWAARVRRAAPLTFHALCAARHPMAAAESVARIPFDRTTDESTTTPDPKSSDVASKQSPWSTEGVPSEFGLQFATFQHPQERELLRTADDLQRVFVDYAASSALPSAVHAKVYTPLFVSVSAGAALELAAAPPAFAAAVDGARTAEDRAAAAACLKGSAAAVAAALEGGNWRAVAAFLSPLRDLPFGPCMEKKKKKAVSPPPPACEATTAVSPDVDEAVPAVKTTKSSAFYPTAGAPKSAAIIEAIAGSAPNAGAHVGVADQESAAQFALKTTPMSIGYCRTEKEMLKICQGNCGKASSEGKGGLASLFKKKQVDRRVLMIGVENTGKTTFLYQLKLGEIVTTVPTIGFNVESCGSPRKKFNLTLWDVGGQDKIRPLWRHYFDGTDGLVFFVNSTSLFHVYEGRENFKKVALELIGSTNATKIALTIICSKQDLPGAVLPEAVAAAFMSITLAELSTVPDNVPEAGDKRAIYFRENPGGPLLSQFGTWRFVGCNALSRTSCAGVVGIIEDDLETLYKK